MGESRRVILNPQIMNSKHSLVVLALAVGSELVGPSIAFAQDSVRVGSTALRAAASPTARVKRQLPNSAWVIPDTSGTVQGSFLLVRVATDTGWISLDALAPLPVGPTMATAAVVKPGDAPIVQTFIMPDSSADLAGATCTLTPKRQTCNRIGFVPKVMQPPASIPMLPLRDQNQVTQMPFIYTIGSTKLEIRIPAGFITDFASVPRPLWSIFPKNGEYKLASVVHDFLYWTRACPRQEQADNLFHIAMQELGVPPWRRNAVYAAVATFGNAAWEENAKLRAAGRARWVPATFKYSTNISGDSLATLLKVGKIKDPMLPALPNGVCQIGNSRKVP